MEGNYELPPDAVAEAIVNAIAHRDYYGNASVEVRLFADRLEVWNPGILPGNLTGPIPRTAARVFRELANKGLLVKVGRTGRSAHYVLGRKQDINRTNETQRQTGNKPDKQDMSPSKEGGGNV